MKIGIYTQPLRYNYGGILQNWALQRVLIRMGHTVETIDPSCYLHLSWQRLPLVYVVRFFRMLIGRVDCIRLERKWNKLHDEMFVNIKPFVEKNIKRYEFKRLNEIRPNEFDVLIAGSDQVWRPSFNVSFGTCIENAFFDFARDWNVRRIAYASSFGTDEWEFSEDQTKRCASLARLFSAISVREKSAIDLCKQHLGVNAIQVLDPTLLLEKHDYEQVVKQGKSECPSGNLYAFMLDLNDEKKLLVEHVANDRKLTPFFLQTTGVTLPSVEQWLRNFMECVFVITDSFHGCLFSLIFNRPFIVTYNDWRGNARFKSLIELFGIEKHLLSYPWVGYNSDFSYVINQQMQDTLEKYREKSLAFLRSSIGVNA